MKIRKISLFASIAALALAILACTINTGGPAYPDQHIPVSTEAAGELQSAIQTAVTSGAESGQVSLVITEPQVYLRDGQIQVYGTASQGYLQATVLIVITASVDTQGQIKIELTNADFGPLPVPTGLREAVTAAVQEAYTGEIGPAAVGFRMESITVADGVMTIAGRTK